MSGNVIKHLSKCYEHIQWDSVREKKAEMGNLKPTFLSAILAETLMIKRSNPQEELRAKHFVRREERLTDSGN